MAIKTQLNDGSINDANAYSGPAALRAFALDRGVDLTATLDPVLEVAIIKATDFMDSVFPFIGEPKFDNQGTAWPRRGVLANRHLGLPPALVAACHKLALRAAQNTVLIADPTTDPSGLVVASKTDKVGPIESTVAYFQPSGGASGKLSGRFPDVELGLRQAGLLRSAFGGTIGRG